MSRKKTKQPQPSNVSTAEVDLVESDVPTPVQAKSTRQVKHRSHRAEEVEFTPGKFKPTLDLKFHGNPEVNGLYDLPIRSLEDTTKLLIDRIVSGRRVRIAEQSEVNVRIRDSLIRIVALAIARKLVSTASPQVLTALGDEKTAIASVSVPTPTFVYDLVENFGAFSYGDTPFHPRNEGLLISHFYAIFSCKKRNDDPVYSHFFSEDSISQGTFFGSDGHLAINVNNVLLGIHDSEIFFQRSYDFFNSTYATHTEQGAGVKLVLNPSMTQAQLNFIAHMGFAVPTEFADMVAAHTAAEAISRGTSTMDNVNLALGMNRSVAISVNKGEMIRRGALVQREIATVYTESIGHVFEQSPIDRKLSPTGGMWQIVSAKDDVMSSPFSLDPVNTGLCALFRREEANVDFNLAHSVARYEKAVGADLYSIVRESAQQDGF